MKVLRLQPTFDVAFNGTRKTGIAAIDERSSFANRESQPHWHLSHGWTSVEFSNEIARQSIGLSGSSWSIVRQQTIHQGKSSFSLSPSLSVSGRDDSIWITDFSDHEHCHVLVSLIFHDFLQISTISLSPHRVPSQNLKRCENVQSRVSQSVEFQLNVEKYWQNWKIWL